MKSTNVIDLQFTTMQEEVPDFIYEGLKPYVKQAFAYQLQPLFLKETLAKQFNLPPDWVFLTNGINEALQITLGAFGKNTHIFTPTEYTTTYQFCPTVNSHLSLDGNTYAINSTTIKDSTLIILANPNNPVGFTSPEVIEDLIKNNPQAIIVIDEIYGEFAPELTAAGLLKKYDNLIVYRGFSKSYGLPGIRLGYILSNPGVLKVLSEKSPWANVSILSCGAAQVALDHADYYKNLRNTVMLRKQNVIKRLEKLDLTVVPSLINTVVLKYTSETLAQKVFDHLKSNNILVNIGENGGKVGNDNSYISFTVGTESHMEKLISVLESI